MRARPSAWLGFTTEHDKVHFVATSVDRLEIRTALGSGGETGMSTDEQHP